MARTSASIDSRTYLPEGHEAEILDFIGALERVGGSVPERRPAIVAADGTSHEIPESMVEVLLQVAQALSAGAGVNVAPLNALLTTQEAADYLGISRPTLVRMLERGDLPMERPGRHRFVRLSDLVEFRERERAKRRRFRQEGAPASPGRNASGSTTHGQTSTSPSNRTPSGVPTSKTS